MNLVDSSGWLEYFGNGANADFFAPAIEDTENLIVSTINLYEVFKRIIQQREERDAIQAIAVMQQGRIIEVDIPIAISAAKYSIEFKLPMADSLLLASAKINEATFWTQDADFEHIPHVKYIKK